MSGDRDHYQVLGVEPSATAEEVRAAHRRLVRVLHPDRHVEATEAERALADRRMREINDAWNTLRDPDRRRSYDAQRATRLRSTGTAPTSGAAGTARSARRPAPRRPGTTAGSRTGAARRPPGAPRTANAGRGAYWHPGSAPAEPDDEEGMAVRPATAHLLRKGPVIVIAAVVLGLFVVTAYAGGRGESQPVAPPPLEGCARVYEGSEAIIVPCNTPNDGAIVAEVEAALDCPESAPRYVSVGTSFFCIDESTSG